VVIPIKSDYHSDVNNGRKVDANLLLILNKTGELRKGNIVQYIPANGNETKLPVGIFNKMYNFRKLDVSGKFSFLNIADQLLYEYGYKDGRLFSSGSVGMKPTPNNSSASTSQRATKCTEWYLTTTYYYSDGTTSETTQYLTTTCDGGCSDPMNQSFCQPGDTQSGGGGSGGSSDPSSPDYEEPMTFKTRDWEYQIDQAGWWAVVPTEGFNGMRKRSLPYGGYFTNFIHVTDGFMSTSPYVSWQRDFMKHEKNIGKATVTFTGSIIDQRSGTRSLDIKAQEFFFNQVYP